MKNLIKSLVYILLITNLEKKFKSQKVALNFPPPSTLY